MSFLQPYFLLLLIVPLVLGVLTLRQHRQRVIARSLLVSQAHAHRLVHQLPTGRRIIPRLFILLALALAILALARPYNGFSPGSTASAARNIFIALDVSRSMTTEDAGGSRLDQAKAAAGELIAGLPEDKLGMIVFSGEAQVIIPLTFDHTALKHYLHKADPSWVEHGGTDFGAVLRECTRYYNRHAPTGTNAVIIISDGEDTSEDTKKAAADVQENKLLVITVGTGSRDGKAIPDPAAADGLWRDRNGRTVISKLNPEALASFARATGGKFIHLTAGTDLTGFVADAVSTLDLHRGGFDKAQIPNDLFMYFALPALVLLLTGLLVGTEWRRVGLPLLMLVLLPGLQQQIQAAEAARVADYAAALQQMEKREFRAATEQLAKALTTGDRNLQAAAFLAIGNACTRHSFARLRELYQPADKEKTQSALSALMPPAEPQPGQLLAIAKALRADIRSYDDALAIDPELTQARTNKQRVEEFIRLLEETARNQEKQNPPPGGGGNKDKDKKQDMDQPPPGDSQEDGSDQPPTPEEGNGTPPPPQQGDKKPTGEQAPPSGMDDTERQRTESLLNMYTDEEEGSPIPSAGGQFEPPSRDY